MSRNIGSHAHFLSHETADAAMRKKVKRTDFRLQHYAGEVTYQVTGFLEKNNDLLFRDLKKVRQRTAQLLSSVIDVRQRLQPSLSHGGAGQMNEAND